MDVFERDLFTDPTLIQDPDPYYAELRKAERSPLEVGEGEVPRTPEG